MYLIDPESVERRIQELQQIEMVTRAPGMSRQGVPSRDMSRHDATVRDTPRQEVAPEKMEAYERRIKELEEKAMHLEIDKRSREQIINMLKEDRETLFVQVSNHVRTITDQARVIGQLETRLELGPGRVVEDRPVRNDRPPKAERERPAQTFRSSEPARPYEAERVQRPFERPAAEPEPRRQDTPPVAVHRQREPSYREQPAIEYPPRREPVTVTLPAAIDTDEQLAQLERAGAGDELLRIINRPKWRGPGPEPSEEETMEMVADEIKRVRGEDRGETG